MHGVYVQVGEKVQRMFSGAKINSTENRSVLHTALRAPKNHKLMVDGEDVVAEVHAVLDQIKSFSEKIRSGEAAAAATAGAGLGCTYTSRNE